MTHRWPPLSGLAWNICILFSANDAHMRGLARMVSNRGEDGYAPHRMDTASRAGTTTPPNGLALQGPDSGAASL